MRRSLTGSKGHQFFKSPFISVSPPPPPYFPFFQQTKPAVVVPVVLIVYYGEKEGNKRNIFFRRRIGCDITVGLHTVISVTLKTACIHHAILFLDGYGRKRASSSSIKSYFFHGALFHGITQGQGFFPDALRWDEHFTMRHACVYYLRVWKIWNEKIFLLLWRMILWIWWRIQLNSGEKGLF